MKNDISVYLSGTKLYGDDFTIDEINEWFADEAEAYADLGAKNINDYRYVYHELNKRHGFKFIQQRLFDEALGIGSAYGEEFRPVADSISKITILDPSSAFSNVSEILGTPCKYIKPNADGNMPFDSNKFDLIACLGVMHHIPNVSHVIGECYRCLDNGGIMLLREPIHAMGDWTKARNGLTKRERGIPLNILEDIVQNTGFKIINESFCVFPLIPKLTGKVGITAYSSYGITLIDSLLSKLFSWNLKYHRTKLREKFAPATIYYVLEK